MQLFLFSCDGPNRLSFVLCISSHVTILLGSYSIMPFFASMAHLCMVQSKFKRCFIKGLIT